MDFCMKERSLIWPVIGSVSLYFWPLHLLRTSSIFCWHAYEHCSWLHSPLSVLMYAAVYLIVQATPALPVRPDAGAGLDCAAARAASCASATPITVPRPSILGP